MPNICYQSVIKVSNSIKINITTVISVYGTNFLTFVRNLPFEIFLALFFNISYLIVAFYIIILIKKFNWLNRIVFFRIGWISFSQMLFNPLIVLNSKKLLVLLGLVALCSQLAIAEFTRGFDDLRMASSKLATAETNELVSEIFKNLANEMTQVKTLSANSLQEDRPGKKKTY